jgi:AcrR family transcriptional regulator
MTAEAIKTAGGETVRERLLSKAIELFNRKGYAATTVREIIQAAGVTKPVLYYYFGNKEGIFLELMHEGFKRLDHITESARLAKGSVSESLIDLYERAFTSFQENIPLVRLMHSIYYGPPQGAPYFDFDAFHKKLHDVLIHLVEEGVRAGEFRQKNIQDMTWAIMGAINVVMDVELSHPELSIGRDGLIRVLKLIFEGIAAKPRRARSNNND